MQEELKILKEETYRSQPSVNMPNDMVRVTLTCLRHSWRRLKKLLNIKESDNE